jgi:hypothetical protein
MQHIKTVALVFSVAIAVGIILPAIFYISFNRFWKSWEDDNDADRE